MPPLVQPRNPKQRTALLVGGIAIVAVLAALLGWWLWSGSGATAPAGYSGPTHPPVETEFKRAFFGEELYRSLVRHGRYPVQAAQAGRENPFEDVDYAVSSTTPPAPSFPIFGVLQP